MGPYPDRTGSASQGNNAVRVLNGRVALVTGASQGIGLATAVALAEAGASVAFNYRQQPREAASAVAQIQAAGGRAILLPGDVAEQATVERLVDETVAAFGRLDIAVSNAAFSDRELLLAEGRSSAFWGHRTCFEVAAHPSVVRQLADPAEQRVGG